MSEKLMMRDIGDLVSGTLRELGRQRFMDIAGKLENNTRLLRHFIGDEEYERRHKQYEAEQTRLAAIEAAKSPAQKRRERQAKCRHEFRVVNHRYVCRRCEKRVSQSFALGYAAGHEAGYDDGQEAASDY